MFGSNCNDPVVLVEAIVSHGCEERGPYYSSIIFNYNTARHAGAAHRLRTGCAHTHAGTHQATAQLCRVNLAAMTMAMTHDGPWAPAHQQHAAPASDVQQTAGLTSRISSRINYKI